MADIVGVITSVEDDDYQGKAFKKVTLGTGEVLKVKYGREGALKAKWPLLQEGVAIKFTMKDFTTAENVKIPFVHDIETVERELPPPVKPKTVPIPPPSGAPRPPPGTHKAEPAPQVVGMLTKEIGDMIRAEKLSVVFGSIIANKLTEWYRSQALGISRVSWDGKDLPLTELEPEDIPF